MESSSRTHEILTDGRRVGVEFPGLRESAQAAAERPADFWAKQHAEIMRRVAASESVPSAALSRWSWAAIPALVVLALLMLSSGPVRSGKEASVNPDADQRLLEAVEETVQSDVPPSLAPASLLTADMRRASETRSQDKESTDEN